MTAKGKQPYRQIKKGSGLDALFGDSPTKDEFLDLDLIQLPPEQPRRYFDPQKMQQLVESVKEHGIIEPLLVRPWGNNYQLVAGERRYRAAVEVGLEKVPVVIRELTDEEAVQLSLIENLHREDLNPVEETEGILQLLAIKIKQNPTSVVKILHRMQNEVKGKVTHNVMGNPEAQLVEEVFAGLGLMTWESFVKNRLPLLNLPEKVMEALRSGQIAYTKAKVISSVKEPHKCQQLLNTAIQEQLSLSQIRERIKALEPQTETPSLKKRMNQVYRRLQKAKVWSQEDKLSRLEVLVAEMEAILKDVT